MSAIESNISWRLSPALLNSKNYVLWSRIVALATGGKKKVSFINGNSTCSRLKKNPNMKSRYQQIRLLDLGFLIPWKLHLQKFLLFLIQRDKTHKKFLSAEPKTIKETSNTSALLVAKQEKRIFFAAEKGKHIYYNNHKKKLSL